MDKKTKLKYGPFGIVDMFYKQNWLEYQARKGLLLANDNLFTCRFTVDEPRDRRYRILPYKSIIHESILLAPTVEATYV